MSFYLFCFSDQHLYTTTARYLVQGHDAVPYFRTRIHINKLEGERGGWRSRQDTLSEPGWTWLCY